MNTHKNARLTFHSRALLVRRILEHGLRPAEAAQAAGVSVRTAYKWLTRYRTEGLAGLQERSSRPHSCPHALSATTQAQVIKRRRARQTYRQISQALRIGQSSVARLLRRQGLNRLCALEPAAPVLRYEHAQPGDLLHLDIKKLGRFRKPGHRVTGHRQGGSRHAGWEYVHVAIDDHSRIAFSAVHPHQQASDACTFLLQALRYYHSLGIRIKRVLTDNGGCYTSVRFQRLCQHLKLTHWRTKAYTPRTNGKAERFIQTALREWAYARAYADSKQRANHLPGWLHQYNWHRPHASLAYLPPISRLVSMNNLVVLHN